MSLIVPGEPGGRPWTFTPNPVVPWLDVVFIDALLAERLCQLDETRPDALISIWSTRTELPRMAWARDGFQGPKLVLEFDDVEVSKHGYEAVYYPTIVEVIELAQKLKARGQPTRLLVHCAAGISRSSAVTLAVLAAVIEHGEPVSRARLAMDALLAAEKRCRDLGWRDVGMHPLMRVVKIADRQLGYDRELEGLRRLLWGRPSMDD